MSFFRILFLFSVILSLNEVLPAHEQRIWTDVQGRKMEATLLDAEVDEISLRLGNGRKINYRIDKLSKEDMQFIEQFRQKQKNGSPEGSSVDESDFEKSWPERVSIDEDPEITVVEENPEKKSFIYESDHYRFVSDVRLATSVVRGFSRMFESARSYCMALPLKLSDRGAKGEKNLILLFEKEEDYYEAGGLIGSAGVYMTDKNLIMVPLTSLGVRPVGSGYMLDRSGSNQTLAHEIVHQLTPDAYYNSVSQGWFTEGLAEYVAITPYRSGSFNAKMNLKPIIDSVTYFSKEDNRGRNLGKEIRLPRLEAFFQQSYRDFLSDGNLNYGASTLLVYYFFHFDGEGDARRIKQFLKSLSTGQQGSVALEILLDGRTYEQLQEEMTKSWKKRGIELSFHTD